MKNVRQTSINVYYENKAVLTEQKWDVYDALWGFQPCTATELLAHMQYLGYKWTQVRRPQHQPRLTALVYGGSVKIAGTKICPHTKKEVFVYDISERVHDSLKEKREYERQRQMKKAKRWNLFLDELIGLHRDHGRDLETRKWMESVKKDVGGTNELTLF